MVDMTLNDPETKIRSFILVSVDSSQSHTTSYRLSIATFALGRTVLTTAHNTYSTDNRQTDNRQIEKYCSTSATISMVG